MTLFKFLLDLVVMPKNEFLCITTYANNNASLVSASHGDVIKLHRRKRASDVAFQQSGFGGG